MIVISTFWVDIRDSLVFGDSMLREERLHQNAIVS